MPQITLRLSENIHITPVEARHLLQRLQLGLLNHKEALALKEEACQSGVIIEYASYLGAGNLNDAKCLYEVQWLETDVRSLWTPRLAADLMTILDEFATQLHHHQQLNCVPRVIFRHIGDHDQRYFSSNLKHL